MTILMAAGCAAGPGTTGREGSFADTGETSAAPAITQTTPETGHGSSLTSTPTGKTTTSESSIGDVSKEGAATGDSRPSDNVTRDTGLEDISPVIEPTPAPTPTPYPETVHSQNLEEIQALLPFKVILPRLPGVFTVPPWFSYAPPPGAVGGTFRTDYMVRGERRKISIDKFIWPEFPFPVPLLGFTSRTFSYNDVEVLEQWWLEPRAFSASDTIPVFCFQWTRNGVSYRVYTWDLPLAEARGTILSMLMAPLY